MIGPMSTIAALLLLNRPLIVGRHRVGGGWCVFWSRAFGRGPLAKRTTMDDGTAQCAVSGARKTHKDTDNFLSR
jgi:hypothetical protein